MTDYGHSAAALHGIHFFEMLSRKTGRTMRLIERVGDDDQIVVPNSRIAEFLRHELRRMGKKTRVFSVDPLSVPMQYVGTAPRGRTFFDHTWKQLYIENAIKRADSELDEFSRAMSKTWPGVPEPDPIAEPWIREMRRLP